MSPLLHLVVATLREPVDADAFERTVAQGRALVAAPGVRDQLIGWSGRQLVIATLLDSTADLDHFVASDEHMRFVMQGLAPVISGMWSTAVEAGSAPAIDAPLLWAFALPDHEGVFEWQVRQFLAEVAHLGVAAIVGVTIEERERYRAGGLVALSAGDDVPSLIAGARQRWHELGGTMDDALVEARGR